MIYTLTVITTSHHNYITKHFHRKYFVSNWLTKSEWSCIKTTHPIIYTIHIMYTKNVTRLAFNLMQRFIVQYQHFDHKQNKICIRISKYHLNHLHKPTIIDILTINVQDLHQTLQQCYMTDIVLLSITFWPLIFLSVAALTKWIPKIRRISKTHILSFLKHPIISPLNHLRITNHYYWHFDHKQTRFVSDAPTMWLNELEQLAWFNICPYLFSHRSF